MESSRKKVIFQLDYEFIDHYFPAKNFRKRNRMAHFRYL